MIAEATKYPNDNEFKDHPISEVRACDDGGWEITCDGWCFFCPKESPIAPEVGMTARFYGRGIGSPVRGLFIDGQRVFYRTAQEYAEHSDREIYGVDAADLLARWDAGRSVFTINMGGLGPGYDQAIQITMFEVLRWFVDQKPPTDGWGDHTTWSALRQRIEREVPFDSGRLSELGGLSGAQWGAAVQLAARLYRDGPIKTLKGAETIQTQDNIRFVFKKRD